jgi:hypothetical protein
MEFVEKLGNIALLSHLRNVSQFGRYRAHAFIQENDIPV